MGLGTNNNSYKYTSILHILSKSISSHAENVAKMEHNRVSSGSSHDRYTTISSITLNH